MEKSTRAYLYRVGVALVPLLVMYGIMGESEASLWLGVLGAVLAVGEIGMAAHNTPVKDRE